MTGTTDTAARLGRAYVTMTAEKWGVPLSAVYVTFTETYDRGRALGDPEWSDNAIFAYAKKLRSNKDKPWMKGE